MVSARHRARGRGGGGVHGHDEVGVGQHVIVHEVGALPGFGAGWRGARGNGMNQIRTGVGGGVGTNHLTNEFDGKMW